MLDMAISQQCNKNSFAPRSPLYVDGDQLPKPISMTRLICFMQSRRRARVDTD